MMQALPRPGDFTHDFFCTGLLKEPITQFCETDAMNEMGFFSLLAYVYDAVGVEKVQMSH